jgi:hypothetical protein
MPNHENGASLGTGMRERGCGDGVDVGRGECPRVPLGRSPLAATDRREPSPPPTRSHRDACCANLAFRFEFRAKGR